MRSSPTHLKISCVYEQFLRLTTFDLWWSQLIFNFYRPSRKALLNMDLTCQVWGSCKFPSLKYRDFNDLFWRFDLWWPQINFDNHSIWAIHMKNVESLKVSLLKYRHYRVYKKFHIHSFCYGKGTKKNEIPNKQKRDIKSLSKKLRNNTAVFANKIRGFFFVNLYRRFGEES